MYKLAHYLFGWDYIWWNNSVSQGVSRVHTTPDNTVYYWQYPIIELAKIIYKPTDVLWLTCRPEKYLKNVSTT